MGCCVSTNKASTSSVEFAQPPKTSESNGASFQVEEEKVKEVLLLSETPKWNPKTTTKSEPRKPHQNKNITAFHKFKEEKKSKVNIEKKPFSINKRGDDTSETCSLRTTNKEGTGKRVNGSPVNLHKNRSFSGDISGRRDRTVHGSRNFGSVRLIQCRDQVGQKMVNGGMRRRRDPAGENSFRRSRSPATHADTSFLGRSSSGRRTSRSAVVTARTAPPDKVRRKMEIPAMEGKRPSANESLENPLVSLECFIFI